MNHQDNSPATPARAAREAWEHAGSRRPRLLRSAALVVASFALGAAGTWLAVGRFAGAPPAQAASATQRDEHAGHQMAPGAGAAPTETGSSKRVYISPARQQLIGVRTAEVVHQALDTTIRTVGVIAYDETRVGDVHIKITGWIDRVTVDFVGKRVRKGQPLFTIYSPDLVATQREYLLALKADRQLSGSAIPETREGARSLLAATRERLRLWDVTDAQVDALARTGEPRRTLTMYSPFNGIVLERSAFPGMYITPEMAVLRIADLSTLWVIGQVFEYELGMLRLGQPAEIEFPYGQTTRRLSGRISFIYPEVDPQTRRAKVRVEFGNPGLELKPGSFVTMVIKSSGGFELAIPQEAVIDTGSEQYALLALPDGYFEPRPLKVGAAVNHFYPVLEGLQHGDRVVTSAQFLIDSETNLQAAMQSMVGHGHAMGSEGGDQDPGALRTPAGQTPPKKAEGQAPGRTPGIDHSRHRR